MNRYRKAELPRVVASEKILGRAALALLAIVLSGLGPALQAQAQSQSTPTAQPQIPSQTQTQSQPSPQSAAQTDAGNQPQSLAEAARQAKAQKDKPKATHVYTDDNLSSIHGTISVVGDGSSRGAAGNGNSAEDATAGAPAAGNNSEAYWRSRARAIKDQISQTDQQIADVKAEIAKQGAASFDPSAGLSQGVIIIHDRNAEVKQLEDRKRSLENQLDELGDEARKAGADSGWAR
ncbi:MAG TPA: hypothetical protein VIH46_04930 [Candidatus Acidoferrales bacterium]